MQKSGHGLTLQNGMDRGSFSTFSAVLLFVVSSFPLVCDGQYPRYAQPTAWQSDIPQTFNIEGSNVNFNIQLPQQDYSGDAEKKIAIQQFSKDYYQLLVTCEEDIFTTGVITISADRALTAYCVLPEIFERCSTLSDSGIEELKKIPAVICRENEKLGGKADPAQWSIYGYIRKVQKLGKI